MTTTFESLEIENYKSIKDSGEIRIPGISIILGPNSSGKTNILESILLLKQTLESNQSGLKLNGGLVKTGEFKNIIHEQEIDKNLTYRFNYSGGLEGQDPSLVCPVCQSEYTYDGWFENHMDDEHPDFWNERSVTDFQKYFDHYSSRKYVVLEYAYDGKSQSNKWKSIRLGNPDPVNGLHVSELEITSNPNSTEIIATGLEGDEVFRKKVRKDRFKNILNQSHSYVTRDLVSLLSSMIPGNSIDDDRSFFARPENIGNDEKFANIGSHLEDIKKSTNVDGDLLESADSSTKALYTGLVARLIDITIMIGQGFGSIRGFLNQVTHIGPLRNSPRRIYFGEGGSPGIQSEGDIQLEKEIFSAERSQDGELIEKTNNWLSETGFDCQLNVSEVGVGDLYQLNVVQSGLSVNLADAGFGLSQTLPIIIECVNMRLDDDSQPNRLGVYSLPRSTDQDPIGLIQQPEIHLNPRIEASLGDFFIDVMNSGVDLIMETHSEYLLNRIQRRVADGTIEDEEDIIIYFISKDGTTSQINEINISSTGTLSEWPEGFFQDDFEDAIETLKESL